MKTIKRNMLFENQFAKIFNNDVEFVNGDCGTHFLVESSNGAVVLPITDGGRVVLIRCFRYGIGKSILMFPMGCCEAGDNDTFVTAKRELTEESGYDVDFLVHIDDVASSPSIMSAVASNYIGFGCRKLSKDKLDLVESDAHEFISEVVELSLSELWAAVMRNEIEDSGSERLACKFLLSLSGVHVSEFDGKSAAFIWGAYARAKGGNIHNNPYRNFEGLCSEFDEFKKGYVFFDKSIGGFC
ncbi:NUDIX hydrolase [Photobacterium damselae]|uniref:NUDIX hydrolase n=1 Tax=Photobacterium damselae TaxID=38293 RepID=UPI001F47CD2B|nr:NUDIX hydrolase [Photobacterium damselae]UKA04848.1 NUDIX hydrolase [Photobacterium damselae subsp. damselae]